MGDMQKEKALRITALSAGVYRLHQEEQFVGYAKPLGLFRKKGIKPLVGDYVSVDPSHDPDIAYTIVDVAPQKNALIRPALANIDCLFIFASLKLPSPDWLLLDKLILMAKHFSLDVVLVFSKADLLSPEEEMELNETLSLYASKVEWICVKNKTYFNFYQNQEENYFEKLRTEPLGFDESLKAYVQNKTLAFAGPSGAGKSTFFNQLLGKELMLTGEVSSKIERGRHTTRSVEIYPCVYQEMFFYLVDTPGFSSLSLAEVGVEEEDFKWAYPQYNEWSEACKYNSCRHLNEQACAVRTQHAHFTLSEKKEYERYVALRQQLIEDQKTLIFIQKNSKKRKK